jgi:hypothetical protein
MAEEQNSQQKPRRFAHVSLDLDLQTLEMSVAGTVPNNAVMLDMARRLLDEATWRAHRDWEMANPKIGTAPAELLRALAGKSVVQG